MPDTSADSGRDDRPPPLPGGPDDETLARNQPAVRTGRRRTWLIPATLLFAAGVGALIAAFPLHPPLASVGLGLAVVLMAAILVCAWRIGPPRRRGLTLAWLMGAMAASMIIVLITVLQVEVVPPT